MKRWNVTQMLEVGHQLFTNIHKKKRFANHNHEVHFMAREINEWLPQSIQSIVNGSYTPRHLKRYYFQDEMVDQLHASDRIMQHIILKQLKLTFPHVMNPNCLHVHGPSGVKLATQRVKQALETGQYQYVIRADIKSYYKSIPHYKLLQDIKQLYQDPKLLTMLEQVITNEIETPRGYKNSVTGIALRGPLSQFFSAIYLKPLDDAFNAMDVFYVRYQDDIIILCKTKRQLNRCRRQMMMVLHERRLRLSRKKSRIGSIEKDFHFLGINYLGTQTQDKISGATAKNDAMILTSESPTQFPDPVLNTQGGGTIIALSQQKPRRYEPHPRTLRKAREQVKLMVHCGFSILRIRSYLRKWARWWVVASESWSLEELLDWFIAMCWEIEPAAIAAGLLHSTTSRCTDSLDADRVVA